MDDWVCLPSLRPCVPGGTTGNIVSQSPAAISKCTAWPAGVDYGIVAIIGPQSSGKSTLLNRVFGTQVGGTAPPLGPRARWPAELVARHWRSRIRCCDRSRFEPLPQFAEMDALKGRNQTTKGVWASTAATIDRCTVIIDCEVPHAKKRTCGERRCFRRDARGQQGWRGTKCFRALCAAGERRPGARRGRHGVREEDRAAFAGDGRRGPHQHLVPRRRARAWGGQAPLEDGHPGECPGALRSVQIARRVLSAPRLHRRST